MADTDIVKGYAVSAFSGLGAGALFSWIVGDFNAADYLIEFMSIGPLEIPFILACMVLVRKYGWRSGIFFTVSGLVASILLFRSTESVAPLVFLKIAVSGIILGSPQWFSGTFTARLSAVALPGVILAFLFGAPLIYHGAPEGTLDQLRQEALDMYSSFMSEDQAFNAVENATYLFEGVYKVGLGIFFLGSVILSWLTMIVGNWLLRKIKEPVEPLPRMFAFSLPFHAVWVFLAALALLVLEYDPLFPVALNALFVMAGLYGIQGLAIVTFHMARLSMGPLPRVFFWLLVFVTLSFSGIILILTGVIDNWFSLRSLPSTENGGENNEDK